MACRTVERDSRAVCTELAQCDAIAPGWSDAGREGAGPRAMGAVCRHAEPAHGAGAAVQERDRGRCNAVDSVGSGLRQHQRIAGAAPTGRLLLKDAAPEQIVDVAQGGIGRCLGDRRPFGVVQLALEASSRRLTTLRWRSFMGWPATD